MMNLDCSSVDLDDRGNMIDRHFQQNEHEFMRWLLKRKEVEKYDEHKNLSSAFLDDEFDGEKHIILANFAVKYQPKEPGYENEKNVIYFHFQKL